MCGIIGYTGSNEATTVLIEGLKTLEYRGYDSAGIAVLEDDGISVTKTCGRVAALEAKLSNKHETGTCGIGHTRWATHGKPSDINSHPHLSSDKKFAVVHNGIIENFWTLKEELLNKGYTFKSETDTEVIAQLMSYYYDGKDPKTAIIKTIQRLAGSYALGIVCSDAPGVLYATKVSSPLIIGNGDGEYFFASDVTALIKHTKLVTDLADHQIAIITKDSIEIIDENQKPVKKQTRIVDWDISQAEKQGYDHFMLKEIYEQPKALKETIESRIKYGKINLSDLDIDFRKFNNIVITGCGSAYHAGIIGKSLIEGLCRISTKAEYASELRFSDIVMDKKTLVIGVSQSGETADTIAALKECKRKGATILSIVNVVGSSIATLSDHVIYTWAGPEIAVATTKGYTTQIAVFEMLSIWIAYELGILSEGDLTRFSNKLMEVPALVEKTLECAKEAKGLAHVASQANSVFFIGRNMDYAVGLEGSLKLKEISYIHSEAYAAGELKHGTIALVEDGTPIIALCCYDALYEKMVSNIQQVKARGARILAIATVDNKDIENEATNVILVPKTDSRFMPLIEIIPLQLIAYYVAKSRGCDIDKPKNLAKSVTVE